MEAAFHYEFRARIVHTKEDGVVDFSEVEEAFENKEPILAREKAFQRYQSYIDVLLESRDKKYINDQEAIEELKSFFDNSKITFKSDIDLQSENENQEVGYYNSFELGASIFMIIDKPISDLSIYFEQPYIHGIGSAYVDPEIQYYMLSDEYEYYKYYNYKTKDYHCEIPFLSEIGWYNEEDPMREPMILDILKTPFNWEGYDKPYWWGGPEIDSKTKLIHDENKAKLTPIENITKLTFSDIKKINAYNDINTKHIPDNIFDIINKGETSQVEFRSALLFNSKMRNNSNTLKPKIAKTICAYLNSKGGILIIGVNSNGEIQGLENDFKLAGGVYRKAYFQNEFDQMLAHFLSFSVTDNIDCEFYEIAKKVIFVINVTPSKRRPIFLNGQDRKEFYIRGEVSSRKLTDIEEIANYCIDRFTVQ